MEKFRDQVLDAVMETANELGTAVYPTFRAVVNPVNSPTIAIRLAGLDQVDFLVVLKIMIHWSAVKEADPDKSLAEFMVALNLKLRSMGVVSNWKYFKTEKTSGVAATIQGGDVT